MSDENQVGTETAEPAKPRTRTSKPKGLRTVSEFRLGGAVFRMSAFAEKELADWVLVTPAALPDPATAGHGFEADFLAFAATKADDEAVRVLSPWSIFLPEFKWPVEAPECGCLGPDNFSLVAQALNGDALVASPGPVFDRFLLKRPLGEALVAGQDTQPAEVTFNHWAATIGVDNAWFAPGYPDYSAPTTFVRQASFTEQSGEAHEAFTRAFDSYYYGGLPSELALANKTAYLVSLQAEHGFDYADRSGPGVHREIVTINSLRLRTSRCCTMVEETGAKVFASPLERVAETTTFAGAV